MSGVSNEKVMEWKGGGGQLPQHLLKSETLLSALTTAFVTPYCFVLIVWLPSPPFINTSNLEQCLILTRRSGKWATGKEEGLEWERWKDVAVVLQRDQYLTWMTGTTKNESRTPNLMCKSNSCFFFLTAMQFGSCQGNLNIFYLLVLPFCLPFQTTHVAAAWLLPITSLCLCCHSNFPAFQQPGCYVHR